MSKNLITKEAVARVFRQLVEQYPLSKVSVKMLIESANISRNTFYYHFCDKYELVVWIFQEDMFRNVRYFSNPLKIKEIFVGMCACMYENRRFYQECLKYEGQNSLREYLEDFYRKSWESYITTKFLEAGVSYSREEVGLLARMNARAIMEALLEWVKSGMDESYLEYFEGIMEMIRPELYISRICAEKRERVLAHKKIG